MPNSIPNNCHFYSLLQGSFSHFKKFSNLFLFAFPFPLSALHPHCFCHICMESLVKHTTINADNIALLKLIRPGNTMDDNIICTGTNSMLVARNTHKTRLSTFLTN